jgi:hypothetical protein
MHVTGKGSNQVKGSNNPILNEAGQIMHVFQKAFSGIDDLARGVFR